MARFGANLPARVTVEKSTNDVVCPIIAGVRRQRHRPSCERAMLRMP